MDPDPISPKIGIAQGCPFSALLLAAAMAVWVHAVKEAKGPGQSLDLAVYLDDRALITEGADPLPALQRALRKRGIKVPVDGAYGKRTRAGVRILQRRMKVKPTGIADARVLRRLGVKVRAVASAPGGVRNASGGFDEYPVPQPNDTTPSAAGFVWPANGVVSSPFGPRWGRMHEGLDIAAPTGRPVRAAKAGVVITAAASGAYGNLIVVDHGGGEQTRYAHLSAFAVATGTPVAIGQVIGRIGNTGRSTGPHLHFEIRFGGAAVDPLPYL